MPCVYLLNGGGQGTARGGVTFDGVHEELWNTGQRRHRPVAERVVAFKIAKTVTIPQTSCEPWKHWAVG